MGDVIELPTREPNQYNCPDCGGLFWLLFDDGEVICAQCGCWPETLTVYEDA